MYMLLRQAIFYNATISEICQSEFYVVSYFFMALIWKNYN